MQTVSKTAAGRVARRCWNNVTVAGSHAKAACRLGCVEIVIEAADATCVVILRLLLPELTVELSSSKQQFAPHVRRVQPNLMLINSTTHRLDLATATCHSSFSLHLRLQSGRVPSRRLGRRRNYLLRRVSSCPALPLSCPVAVPCCPASHLFQPWYHLPQTLV